MKQKKIYLVPFPFSDLSQTKVRPVLIVSKNSFNEFSSDIIVCAITSQKINNTISITKNNLESGNLFSKSYIKPSSLFKIDKSLLLKKIGTLDENIFNVVRQKIINLF